MIPDHPNPSPDLSSTVDNVYTEAFGRILPAKVHYTLRLVFTSNTSDATFTCLAPWVTHDEQRAAYVCTLLAEDRGPILLSTWLDSGDMDLPRQQDIWTLLGVGVVGLTLAPVTPPLPKPETRGVE